MSYKNFFYYGLLLALAVSACSPQSRVDEVQVAVIVSLTQTAAALQNQPALPTEIPATSQSPSDYQPLSAEECTTLNTYISQAVGFTGEITSPVPFNDFVAEKNGHGCQIQYATNGNYDIGSQVITSLATLGWQEDGIYAGPGLTGYGTAFRNSDMLCMYDTNVGAADKSACPIGEGYFLCLTSLPPEALLRTTTLNCAHSTNP